MTALIPIRQEILAGGEWVDATPYVRGGNMSRISITRGYSSEQTNNSVGTCTFTLNNRDGRWSNRNPLSPHFGLIGRNVQVRNGLELGESSLRLIDANTFGTSDYDGACAFTLDKAVLDITGDIDVRIEVEPDDWRGRRGQTLAGKYTLSGNQRSWTLFTDPFGYVWIITSSDGTTAGRVLSQSTEPIADDAGRIAIRATVDVNNGAGGNTVTFYTSDSITGSWTQLGDAIVNSGTTSIFSGSANLIVGNTNSSAGRGATFGAGLNADPFTGKIYRFQLRNGIAGTLVADADFTAQAPGTTSWSDGLGTPNTWELQTSAEISDMEWRFWGEMNNPASEWDSTGTDVIVPVQAGDLRQRLSQGQPSPRSPIYRNLKRLADIDGYWTCEDGSGATALNAEYGVRGAFTAASFSAPSDFPGTAGALIFTDDTGYAYGNCTIGPTVTGVASHMWYWRLPEVPTSGTGVVFMQSLYTGGTIARATVEVNNTSYTVRIYSTTGASLATSAISFGSGAEPDQWLAMRLMLTQDGGNVDWALAWYPQTGQLYGGSGSFAGTVGRPRGWNSPTFTDKFGMQLAHVLMARSDVGFESQEFQDSTDAYVGETVITRIRRLSDEEDLPVFVVGLYNFDNEDTTRQMGPQGLLSPVELLQECADADGGLMYACRDKYGLEIRLHSALINRVGPSLVYTDNVLSGRLTPDEGGFGARNDITASRPDGSGRGRFVKTSGPMNVNDPRDDPQGIGTVPGTVTVNAYPDAALDQHAAWAGHLGTWDEARWTNVQLELHRAPLLATPSLAAAVGKLDLGDRFDITDLPAWLPPGDARVMMRGYTEILVNFTRTIVLNGAPYAPWLVNDFSSSEISQEWIGDDGLTTLVGATADVSVATDPGTFESGVGNWVGQDCTVAQSSAQARTGTYSAEITVTGNPAQAYIRPYLSAAPASPGVGYVAGMWIRSSLALTVLAAIDYFDGSSGYVGGSYGSGQVLVPNTWTYIETPDDPAPVGTVSAAYGPTLVSPSNGDVAYVDDVDITEPGGVGDLDETATIFTVATDQEGLGLPWEEGDYSADPLPIKINGERMMVSEIGAASVVGGTWEQELTVTRSVNGVVREHEIGSPVAIDDAFYVDL
jgi:hypothetical protein